MAELTPPSSRNNTPQRLDISDDDVLDSSPTGRTAGPSGARPHPLATTSGGTGMELDSVDDLDGSGDGDESDDPLARGMDSDEVLDGVSARRAGEEGGDHNMGESGSESDDGIDVDGTGKEAGESGMASATGVGKGAGRGISGGIVAAIEGLGRRSSTRGSKRKSKRARRRVPVPGGPAGPLGSGERMRGTGNGAPSGSGAGTSGYIPRREGELYESEMVARWNSQFGDVCAVPKETAATDTAAAGAS